MVIFAVVPNTTPNKKNFWSKAAQFLAALVDIGVSDNKTKEKNLIRLSNIIYLCGISSAALFVFVFHNLKHYLATVIDLSVFLVSLIGIYLNANQRTEFSRFFVLFSVVIISVFASFLYGENGGIIYYTPAFLTMGLYFLDLKPFFFFSFLFLGSMLGVNYMHDLPWYEPKVDLPAFYKNYSIIIAASITFITLVFYKKQNKQYESELEYNLLQENLSKKEFQQQIEQLKRSVKALEDRNKRLALGINKRTEELKAQLSRVQKLAFYNSHRIRKPVANLLGICSLLNDLGELEEEERKELITLVSECTDELENVIEEFNAELHERNLKSA